MLHGFVWVALLRLIDLFSQVIKRTFELLQCLRLIDAKTVYLLLAIWHDEVYKQWYSQ